MNVAWIRKNQAPPLMTELTFDIVRRAEGQLERQGQLTKPIDYNAFVCPELLRKGHPKKVDDKP